MSNSQLELGAPAPTAQPTADTSLPAHSRPPGFTHNFIDLRMDDGSTPSQLAWVDSTKRVALHRQPNGTGYRVSLIVNGRAMHLRLPDERVEPLKRACRGLAKLFRSPDGMSIGLRMDRGDYTRDDGRRIMFAATGDK